MAGERVRLILNRLADITRNRSSEYDSEGQSEMGGQRRCNRAGHFHRRAIWHRRVTPKSIEQPSLAVQRCSTEFRNGTNRSPVASVCRRMGGRSSTRSYEDEAI